MKYSAIIFDMDGVLIDSEELWDKCETAFFQNFIPNFTAQDQTNIIGGCLKNTYQYLKNNFTISLTEDEFIQKYIKFGLENIYQKTQPTIGVVDFLETIKQKNIPLALASSSYYAWINTALDRLNLRQYFDIIVSAEDLNGKGKPAPDIFLKTAELLKVSPSNCLVLEDSKNGVISGKSAGMTVYGIRNGVNDTQDLSQADKIFTSFKELEI